MTTVFEFFANLFDVSSWPPRWICGEWSSFHGWLYITSDLVIWLAYFIIPAIIIFFIQKKRDIPFLPVFFLFGAFILLCGSTHLIDAIMFWWPAYRVSGILRFATAVVSFLTAISLVKNLPNLLLSENDSTSKLNQQLQEKNKEIEQLKLQLNERSM